jgi:hypothetical protein
VKLNCLFSLQFWGLASVVYFLLIISPKAQAMSEKNRLSDRKILAQRAIALITGVQFKQIWLISTLPSKMSPVKTLKILSLL